MIDRKKHSYFKQIAGRRVERILEGLEALGNCSSPATYDYDNQELPPIFEAGGNPPAADHAQPL